MDDVKPDADDAIDDVKPDADDAMDDVKPDADDAMDDVKPDKDDVNPTIIFNTSSSYCGYCDFIIFLITSSFGKTLEMSKLEL
jgi:hypothetical protein